MAPPYIPQLTAWRAAVGGGVERELVEHEGTVYDLRDLVVGHAAGTGGEPVRIGGEEFALAYEKEVAVLGGKVVRCVEYYVAAEASASVEVVRLTVTEGEKEVAEVVERPGCGAALVLAGSGGGECYFEEVTGTWEHVVDVQGEYESFTLLVSVREEDDRIVRIQRLS